MRRFKKTSAFVLSMLLVFAGMTQMPSAANLKTQKIQVENQKICLNNTEQLSVKAKGKLTYIISNKSILTISKSGKMVGKRPGTTKVKIVAAKTKKYKAATKTIKVSVMKDHVYSKPVPFQSKAVNEKQHTVGTNSVTCKNCGKQVAGTTGLENHDFTVEKIQKGSAITSIYTCKKCGYQYTQVLDIGTPPICKDRQ